MIAKIPKALAAALLAALLVGDCIRARLGKQPG